MSARHTLSVLESGPKDLVVMRSLLNLVDGSESGLKWSVSDQPGGSLTIIDVDSQEGREVWEEHMQRGERPVALTRSLEFEAHHLLQKPLRARDFLDLMTSSWQVLTVNGADPSEGHEFSFDGPFSEAAPDPAGMPDSPRWQAWELTTEVGSTLAEHLRRQTWKSPVVITQPGWPRLLIDTGSGSWFYDGSIGDLSPEMFSVAMPASVGRPISSSELVSEIGMMMQRPLSELKWYAGLTQSRGRLHPHLVDEVEFMLTQAPPEARDDARFMNLARILIRGPITLDRLAAQSGEETETVCCFLNACYTSGRLLINQPARAVSF